MSRINEIIDKLDQMLAESDEQKKLAEEELEEAERLKLMAYEKALDAEEAKDAAIVAKEKMNEAKDAYDVASDKASSVTGTDYNEEKNKKSGKGKKIAIGVVSVFAAAALLAGGYVLGKSGVLSLPKKDNDDDKLDDDNKVVSDTLDTDVSKNDSVVNYDYENNEVIIDGKNETYERLTNENFGNLVVDLTKIYIDKNVVSVSTEDILKFVSIANIDKLSEENKELAQELFGNQSKEEYLNDVAKVIGATVMYNNNVYMNTNSTEDFIKVSDSIIGSQKENMIKIEEHTNKIAEAVKKDDKDLVNALVSEFILDLNSGELSKLDDGVGFAAQVNIALISDVIAGNYLNQENFNMLQILKTGEKHVSNIFTVYEGCIEVEEVKTLTR